MIQRRKPGSVVPAIEIDAGPAPPEIGDVGMESEWSIPGFTGMRAHQAPTRLRRAIIGPGARREAIKTDVATSMAPRDAPSTEGAKFQRSPPRSSLAAWCLLVAGAASWLAPARAKDLVPDVVSVPAAACDMDERAYGHDATRREKWYASEWPRSGATTAAYLISRTPIANAQYQAFVDATGRRPPTVDRATWEGYRLVHPFARTRRHAWVGGRIPPGRDHHLVVLVSHDDAVAYAARLTTVTGQAWRLPTDLEWERAARGVDGRRFPWGDSFDPERLDSADAGPLDTVEVGHYPAGDSPVVVADMAGLVFEWTATPAAAGRSIVKGGSWDDKGCGVCRPAARHARPAPMKHVIIGFRLVREAD